MINDVKKIRKSVSGNFNLWDVRKYLLKSDREKAEDKLIERMLSEIEDFYYSSNTSAYKSIEHIKYEYEKIFDKLGFKVPEGISKLKDSSDMDKLTF